MPQLPKPGEYDVTVVAEAVDSALKLLPQQMDSLDARVLLITTALQESKGLHRRQLIRQDDGSLAPTGPATSLWQCELGGGVRQVMSHPASRFWAHYLCKVRGGVTPTSKVVWRAIEVDDVLAAGVARLNYFTWPRRLPPETNAQAGWDYYIAVWRPGKPHRETWDAWHAIARRSVYAFMENSQ